jgi:predicted TIM-barrel fold metal-dependent hydrolase
MILASRESEPALCYKAVAVRGIGERNDWFHGIDVLERFKRLRFATVEAGIGWVPWLLAAMDEAYRKHHMWVRPKLQGLPSDYYRAHGFATFQEDPAGLALAERRGLTDNFMWANDYPHHEGTWPHSAEAIERTMAELSDVTRAKILGLNAARFFKLDVPAHQRLAA